MYVVFDFFVLAVPLVFFSFCSSSRFLFFLDVCGVGPDSDDWCAVDVVGQGDIRVAKGVTTLSSDIRMWFATRGSGRRAREECYYHNENE